MPRISELNGTGFPTLDHEFPTEHAGESVKLTIAQVRALMGFLATEVGYNAGTVAEALDDLASGKVGVSEYTAAINSKMNNLLYTPGGAPLDSGFNDIVSPGPAPRLARSATGGSFTAEAPTLDDYYYVLVFEFGGNLVQVAFPYLGGAGRNCYFRARMAGTWSAWQGLVNSASLITNGTFADARIPNLNASKVTAGRFDPARLPVKLEGIVADTRPRFSASKASQQTGIGNGKVTFTNEVFDVGGHYDTANSRWTPPAGTYKIGARVLLTGVTDQGAYVLTIHKNGIAWASNQIRASSASGESIPVEDLVESNGTDYWEVFLLAGSGTANVEATYRYSAFYGYEV